MSRVHFLVSYGPLVSRRCACFKTTFNGWDGALQIGWSRFLAQLDNFLVLAVVEIYVRLACYSTLRTTLNRGRPSQMTVLET